MALDDDENEPYTRWQGFRISQLGLCITLFLTFSVAILGFSVNLLVQPMFRSPPARQDHFLALAYSRIVLCDFRSMLV